MPHYPRLAVLLGLSALSLNGTWEFAYHAGPANADPLAAFKPITVPGHWELQGFAEPKSGKELAEGQGYYHRTFRVPAAWAALRDWLGAPGAAQPYFHSYDQ